MAIYVKHGDEVMDFISDGERIAGLLPRYEQALVGAEELRDLSDHLAMVTNWGRQNFHSGMGRVATIPHSVLNVLLELEPDLLADKRKFYDWLDRHPEYQTIRRK